MTDVVEPRHEGGAVSKKSIPTITRLFSRRDVIGGFFLLVILVTVAFMAPFISPYDHLQMNRKHRFQPPSMEHPFGTDEFGRDIMSRVFYASRISLLSGLVAVALASLIGIPLGLIGGYFGGLVDSLTMRAIDCLLAFPAILLAMGIVAVMGPSTFNAMVAIAIISVPTFARLTRAGTLNEKGKEYVESARAIGAGEYYIMFRHILPNILSPLILQATISMTAAIILEASLSFLGLGTQPPHPSLGSMLQSARGYLDRAWWYVVFPGLFITVLITGLLKLSEGLRYFLDPQGEVKV